MAASSARLRNVIWVAIAAVAVAIWLAPYFRLPITPAQDAPPASPLELLDADGASFTLDQLRGRVVVVNLWASWCAPCRSEASTLARVQRSFDDEELTIVGLNADGLAGPDLRRVARDWGIPYVLASPVGGTAGTTFAGRGVVPHTWILDRDGRVRVSRAGVVTASALGRACRRLLQEPG